MKIIIKKYRYNDMEIVDDLYNSELSIEMLDDNCTYNYLREYHDKKKEVYTKTGKLYLSESKYKHLIDLINNIKNNIKYKNNEPIKKDFYNSLNYIFITIENEDYRISVEDIEYELLIHLSEFEFFDKEKEEILENKI